MSNTANLRDILCRYRDLSPEQAAFERSTDYVTFLDVEEVRLRRLIDNLRFNQDFERIFYECQLDSCVLLLKIWKKKSRIASKALKRFLRRRGNTIGNKSTTN